MSLCSVLLVESLVIVGFVILASPPGLEDFGLVNFFYFFVDFCACGRCCSWVCIDGGKSCLQLGVGTVDCAIGFLSLCLLVLCWWVLYLCAFFLSVICFSGVYVCGCGVSGRVLVDYMIVGFMIMRSVLMGFVFVGYDHVSFVLVELCLLGQSYCF